MRDNVLAIVIFGICAVAFFRPRIGLYGYIWYALMRPDVLAFSSPSRPYSLLLAVITLASSLRHTRRLSAVSRNPMIRWLLCLQVIIILSIALASDPALAWVSYFTYIRIIVICLLIPLLIETADQLKTLLTIMASSIGLLGIKFGLYGLWQGGARFNLGYGGMLSDNNDLALCVTMGIALSWYAREWVGSALRRAMCLASLVAGSAAVAMTYSRGGALALGTVFFVIIYRSKHRVLTFAAIALIIVPLLFLLGPSYTDRLATLKDPTSEASAGSRIENYIAALELWKDYPILGVGFGGDNERRVFSRYTHREASEDIMVHDTYLQMLVDSGIFAFLVYTGLLLGTIAWLGSARQQMLAEQLDCRPCLNAIQLSLIAFAIGAIFLSRSQFDVTYFLLMSGAAWWQIQQGAKRAASNSNNRFQSAVEMTYQCILQRP